MLVGERSSGVELLKLFCLSLERKNIDVFRLERLGLSNGGERISKITGLRLCLRISEVAVDTRRSCVFLRCHPWGRGQLSEYNEWG